MMQLDYNVPVWAIITTICIPFLVWLIVGMFNHRARIKALETSREEMKQSFVSMQTSLQSIKKDTDDRLEKINTTTIETRTLVSLLVKGKIKNGDGE